MRNDSDFRNLQFLLQDEAFDTTYCVPVALETNGFLARFGANYMKNQRNSA